MRSAPGVVLLLLLGGLAACGPAAPSKCELTFSDEGSVRVFVVGHHFVPADARTHDTFEASFRRHADRIRPCLSTARPNLIVFPEDAGLIAWFIGRRAAFARGAGDVGTAFNALYAGYYRASDAYRARYPGISAARGLTLALGDTTWRAMDRTFGGIAEDLGAWVITSANAPDVVLTDDPDAFASFGDPDAPGRPETYVAAGPDVFNQAILYGPAGDRLDVVRKAYLTDPEEELLNLSNGPMSALRAFELPFGTVGAAISRDAFYAPYLDRLEELGAELVVQPEAWNGWTVEQQEGDWLPDVILASAWTHTQKHAGFRHNVAPMLTGNLFDLIFDGQVWITAKADPAQTVRGFVGSKRLPGWEALGPWAFEDPVVDNRRLSLAERRRTLRGYGQLLSPGSASLAENDYVDSLVAADLALSGPVRQPAPRPVVVDDSQGVTTTPVAPSATGHQRTPDAAFDAAERLYVVWADTRAGLSRIYVTTSDDGGLTFAEARPVTSTAPSQPQQNPSVAARGEGEVVIVWQQGAPGEEQIHHAWSMDGGATFVTGLTSPGPAMQWRPDVALHPTKLDAIIVWSDFREGLSPQLRVARSFDGSTWRAAEAVDLAAPAASDIRGSQVQPSAAWTSDGPAITWLDYRTRDWKVRVARSGATGWIHEALDPGGTSEVLASDPQLVALSGAGLAVVWDDQRARRGHHDVLGAWRSGDSGWQPLPVVPGGAEEGAFVSRFRPAAAARGGALHIVFQDLAPRKGALSMATFALSAEAVIDAPVRLDDTGSSPNHLTRPRLAADAVGRLVAVFEDDREGWSRVYTALVP